jgi:hypothetical protein
VTLRLFTASFRSFRRSHGLPVVIALQLPKWRDDCRDWPACHLLSPRWSYFYAPDAEFDRQYVAQLERFGFPRVKAVLERIAREHDADRLALICHEARREECHRALTARWLAAGLGESVDEVDAPAPMHANAAGTVVQVEFRPGGKRYSYDCPDEVDVGDTVMTPRGVPVVVLALGSDYPGPFATARRIST